VSVGPSDGPDPERWLEGATTLPGSWWEPWARWAAERSGELRPAPASLGSCEHPPGCPAPGHYVVAP